MRQFQIKLVEVKENGLTPKQLDIMRNVLSDLMDGDGVKLQLALANAILDANAGLFDLTKSAN